MRSQSIWAVLLTAALAFRMLLAPAHLSHHHADHQDHAAPVEHACNDHAPGHHDTDSKGTGSCFTCSDLLLTKHVGGGPCLCVILIERAPLAVAESSASEDHASFALAGGGPRGPPGRVIRA